MYQRWIKPIVDFTLAGLFLVIFLPIILIITVFLTVSGQPPFFTQLRPGLNGKTFRIIKFRTMTNDVDENGDLLPDEERLTFLGKVLRTSSLDELPQLINVLKGEMSLIGPRPLLVQYLSYYNEFHGQRHMVKPGISGWAQINGRNNITWTQRLDLDIEYVHNLSFAFDVRILWKTILVIFNQTDITPKYSQSMQQFSGYDNRE